MVGKVGFVVRIVRTDPSGGGSPFLGSGVLVSANQVLTCRHVIELSKPGGDGVFRAEPPLTANQLVVECEKSEKTERIQLAADPILHRHADLALLTLAQPLGAEPPRFIAGLTAAILPLLEDSKLWSYGYAASDRGQFLEYVRTHLKEDKSRYSVEDVNQLSKIYCSEGLSKGFSGGPLLVFAHGHPYCLGINRLGGDANDWTQAVAADIVLKFLTEHHVAIPLPVDANATHALLIEAKNEPTNAPLLIGENPYQGLEAFSEKDAERFFGRDEEIEKFLQQYQDLLNGSHENLTPIRILPVLGPSGSGKSSLVKAGLIPRIRQLFSATGRGTLNVCVFSPRSRPLRELASQLTHLNPDDHNKIARTKEYETHFRETTNERYDGLVRIADTLATEVQTQTDRHFLLVIDQFEEIYTPTDRNADQQTTDNEADIFVANLLEAAADRESRVSIIITLRSDFYDQLTRQHKALASLCAGQRSLIGPPTEEGLTKAITEPAERAGYPLDDIVTAQLVTQAMGNDGALPLLQVALGAIWEGIRQHIPPAQTLHKLGGVGGALNEQAETLFNALSETEQELARHILLTMVHIGEGTPDARLPVQINGLKEGSDEPDRLERVLQHLVGTTNNPASHHTGLRLITMGNEKGERYAEIVHEALLHRWKRLHKWIEVNRDNLRIRVRILERMKAWKDNGKSNDLLLHKGKELEIGRTLLKEAKEIPVDDIKHYVQHSVFVAEQAEKQSHRLKQRTIWLLTAISLALVFFLVTSVFQREKALVSEQTAQQNLLEANFNSAKFYEERALNALAKAQESGDADNYRAALLYASEAALLKIPEDQQALSNETFGELLLSSLTRDAFNEYWVSPAFDLGVSLHQLAFSPDGRWLATGGETVSPGGSVLKRPHQLFLWEVANGRLAHQLSGHVGEITGLSFTTDSRMLASASLDGSVRLWEPEQGRLLNTLEGDEPFFNAIFYPGEQRIAMASPRGVLVWKPDVEHAYLQSFRLLEHLHVQTLDLDLSGKWLAIGGDSQAHIYASESGALVHTLRAQGDESSVFLPSVVFSPDSSLLATANEDVHIWNTETGEYLQTFKQGKGKIGRMAFSPDGITLATDATDNNIRLWNLQSNQVLATLIGHDKFVNDIAFTPDGNKLASVSRDKSVRFWDTKTGVQIHAGDGHRGLVSSITVSPDGNLIASGSSDSTVRLWDTASGKLVSVLNDHQDEILDLDFSPNSNSLVTGSRDGTVRLWDAVNKELIHVLSVSLESQPILSVAFSPDGSTLVASSSNTVYVWSAGNGELLNVFEGPENNIGVIGYNLDGDALVAFLEPHVYDQTIELWDIMTGSLIQTFGDHGSEYVISDLAFDPTGRVFATVSDEQSILWDMASGSLLHVLPTNFDNFAITKFSSDGSQVATPSGDKIYVWEVAGGKLNRTLNANCEVTSFAFTPDDRALVTGCMNKTVRMFNAASGSLTRELNANTSFFSEDIINYSSDGRWLAVGNMINNTVQIWDSNTGHLVNTIPVKGSQSWDVSFHPNKPWLAVGSLDHTINVWDTISGELKYRFAGNSYADDFILSPDGRYVAILAPGNQSLLLWDIKLGALHRVLEGHQHPVNTFVFSPDSQRIATASDDNTVRLWDVVSGESNLTITQDEIVYQLAFSPDGRTLLTVGNKLGFWDADTGHLNYLFEEDFDGDVIFSPDGKQVAVASSSTSSDLSHISEIYLWDVASGEKTGPFETDYPVRELFFLSNTVLLVLTAETEVRLVSVKIGTTELLNPYRHLDSTNTNVSLQILDGQAGEWLSPDDKLNTIDSINSGKTQDHFVLPSQSGGVVFIEREDFTKNSSYSYQIAALSSNNQLLASQDKTGTLQIRDLQSDQLIRRTDHLAGNLTRIVFTPGDDQLITQHAGQTVQLWNIESGELLNNTIEYGNFAEDRLDSIVFSPDGQLLALRGLDSKKIHLWETTEDRLRFNLAGHEYAVTHLAFSSNGLLLASGARESVKIWDVQTGALVGTLPTNSNQPIDTLAFSPDGATLVWTIKHVEGKLYLWDVDSLSLQYVLKNNHTPVFSPDGRILATNMGEDEVKLWNIASGEVLQTLPGKLYGKNVESSFTPDGRIMATKTSETILSLWEVNTGHKLRELSGVKHFAFAPDGRSFVTDIVGKRREQGGLHIWPLDTRLLDLFSIQNDQQRAVLQNIKQAAEFLWERNIDGLDIVERLRQPRLYPQNDYFFGYDDRFRSLLNPPSPGESKFDQVYQWAVVQTMN